MTQELVPANSPVAEVIQRIQREIQSLRGAAHILTPMARTKIDSVAIGKIPVLRVTTISSNPDDHEVYTIPALPGKLILTKVGLMRLDALAGITDWTTRADFIDKNPLKARGEASASIEDIDGTKRTISQNFQLDLTDGSPQASNKKPAQLAQARANIITLVETGAMNRVRRVLLGLQSTFTAEELKKPFVIMKLVDAPLDTSDPLIRKLLVMKQLKISAEVYESAAHDLDTIKQLSPPKEEPKLIPAETTETLKANLISRIEDLYRRKVRGGRSSDKVPLTSLEVKQLVMIEDFLNNKPDISA